MAILVNTLNETRDIYAFIRDVRTAYRPLVSLPTYTESTGVDGFNQFDTTFSR